MSLLSAFAAGARASAQPSGFAGFVAGAGSLAITGLAIAASAAVAVTPAAGAVTAAGTVPIARAGVHASPGTGSIAVAGRPVLPIVGAGVNVNIGDGGVVIAGLPFTASYGRLLVPATGSLALNGSPPIPRAGVSTLVSPGSLSLSGMPASAGGGARAVPLLGSLAFTGRPVSTFVGGSITLTIPAGSAAIDGKAITAGGGARRIPAAGAIAIDGQPASAATGLSATPGVGSLVITGRGLTIATGAQISASIGLSDIVIAGLPVTSRAGVNRTIPAGAVTIAGRPAYASNSTELEPNTSDGLPMVQLGLSTLNAGNGGENPFKNYRKMLNSTGGPLRQMIADGDWDPATGEIYVPPGVTYTLDRVRPLAAQPANFDIDPGVWVLKATVIPNSGAGGAAPTVDMQCAGFVSNGSSGSVIRKTRDLTGQLNGNQVTLVGGANGGRLIIDFWGPQIWENDPPNDWHPNFLQYCRRYKVLRNLDWVGASGSKIVRDDQWIRDTDYNVWLQGNSLGFTPPAANIDKERAGFSYGLYFNLCVAAGAAAHVCVPLSLGATVVENYIRGYDSNGPYNGTQLKDAVFANGAQILTESEVEFFKHGQRIGQSLLNEGYPDKRALFLEPGNENWNQATRAFARGYYYCDAIGQHLTGSLNNGYGFGAISARAFKNLKKGILSIKPNQTLVFVMGVQTAAFNGVGGNRVMHIDNALKAFIAADAEAVPKIDIWLATTGYWSGAHKWSGNRSIGPGNMFGVTNEAAFDAAYIASHSADVAAHRALVKSWFLNPTPNENSNIAGNIGHNTGYRDLAISRGFAGILQYEGSNHDDPTSGTLPTAYPAVRTEIVDFLKSQEAHDVQLALIDALRAINPTNPAKVAGWRPSELLISNYRDVGRLVQYTGPWTERQADEINANIQTGAVGAWQKRTRHQPGAFPAVIAKGSVTISGRPVLASAAGSAVTASPGAGGVSVAGHAVTASAPSSTLLASWPLADYPTIAALETAGWTFTGDWQIVNDGGALALHGTTGIAMSPSFRAPGTGARAARIAASMKIGDVAAASDLARFIDSTTGLYAALRIDSAERLSLRRFNSATTFVTASLTQSIGAYAGFGAGAVFDDVSGFARLIQNGAANGEASGDSVDTAPAGIDRIAFVANPSGVYLRNSVDVHSDATGGVSSAAASATPAPGALNIIGLPVRPAAAGVTLLASWNLNDYQSIAEMQAAGFVFDSGHGWALVQENGDNVLTSVSGAFRTPSFRAANSGALSARLKADMRFGNVVTEAAVFSFFDTATNREAAVRISPVEKLRMRRFGATATFLTATNVQPVAGFTNVEAAIFLADINGVGEFKRDGAANGSFTGDTIEQSCAGLDAIRFYGIAEGISLRGVIEVYSNAPASAASVTIGAGVVVIAGRPALAGVSVARTPAPGAVSIDGLLAVATDGAEALLGDWPLDQYTDINDMIADGWVFEAGSDWTLVNDGGAKALYGTTGYVQTPQVRAAASGKKSMRAVFSMKAPDIASQQIFMHFRDGGSSQFAPVYLNSVQNFSVRRFNNFGATVLTTSGGIPLNTYVAIDLSYHVDPVLGEVILKRNGAFDAFFTGDTADGTPAGLSAVRFYGLAEGVYVKAPSLWARAPSAAVVQKGALAVDGHAVTVAAGIGGGSVSATPGVGAITIDGKAVTAGAGAGRVPVKGAVEIVGKGAIAGGGIGRTPGLGAVTIAGQAVDAQIVNYTWTVHRVDYDDGLELGFGNLIKSSQFPGGSAHEFFQSVQSDFGDMRVFLDDGETQLPLEIWHGDKAAGEIWAFYRLPAALARSEYVLIRTGGIGTLSQPAASDASLGSRAVWTLSNFTVVSHDLTSNSVDGAARSVGGAVSYDGPDGVVGLGFGSLGSGGTTDHSDLSSFAHTAPSGYWALTYRVSNGVSDALASGRITHSSQGFDIFNEGTSGFYKTESEFSTTDGEFRFTRPAGSQWHGVGINWPDSTAAPEVYVSGAAASVTTIVAPVGSFVPATQATVTGNHSVGSYNRGWDGAIAQEFRWTGAKSAAWFKAQEAIFAAAGGVMKALPSVNVLPSWAPSKELEAWLAAMTTQPSLALQQDLDGLLIKPLYAAGVWQDGDLLYALALETSQAAGLNGINPSLYALSAKGAPTFTANRGMNYDGVDDMHNTGWNFPGGAKASQNSFSMAIWSRTAGQVSNASMGAKRTSGSVSSIILNPRNTSDLIAARANDDASITASNTDGTGFYLINRSASNAQTLDKNGTQVASGTETSLGLPNYPIGIGGVQGNGGSSPTDSFAAREISFAWLGRSLDSTKRAALYDAVNDFLAARFAI